MKKLLLACLCLVMLFATVSCSSTRFATAKSQNKNVVGLNGVKRPDWVLYDLSNKKTHYAVGYGTGKTLETAKYKARLAADSEMAMWISTTVESMRDRYVEENIKDDDTQYIDKFVMSAKEAGKAMLSGIQVEDFWQDAEGGYYVLVSIPMKNVKAQIEETVASAYADTSIFSDKSQADVVIKKLNAVLDSYFPEN